MINDKLKDYKSAIYHYDKVLTGTSADYKIYFAIGVDCINLKDYSNAIVAFSKCIECDNKKKDAYYNRGLVYEKLGQTKNAEND